MSTELTALEEDPAAGSIGHSCASSFGLHTKIQDLLVYIDDNFSWELAHQTLFYRPYGRFFLKKQTCLLELWDGLWIPHAIKKQEYGTKLKIISYFINAESMTITVNKEGKKDLLEGIKVFCGHGKPM